MARNKKGRPVSGWVIIDKPAGLTSTAVVNKVKWAFQAQKAGHSGTLDPEATGLLAVALGEATKTIPFITDALKAYEFTMRFGIATDTDDAEGDAIAQSDDRPTAEEVEGVLPKFVGDISQVPPKYSAVKIDGERAYDLARAGEHVDVAARPLYVDALTLLSQPDQDHAVLEFVCGKGGYVRSIARDIGEELGCFGHVKSLRRIWSGPFDVENAVDFETIERLAKTPEIDDLLLPVSAGLSDMPELQATAEGAARLRNGNPGMVIASNLEFGDDAWASYQGRPVAIGKYKAGELHPNRVFNL